MKSCLRSTSLLAALGLCLSARVLAANDPSVTDKPVLLSPEASRATFTLPPGYEITLFASEEEFPIRNPVAMKWDSRGRLWVANCPSYPHIGPDQEYHDSIVILEDKDQDGKADNYTIFADKLYLPIGFVIGDGGAYVSSEPNLLHLVDTDGDDIADERRVVLRGFGSEDSHHAISAYQWAPDGSFYMAEGTFLVSNVETPWGPRRVHDSAVFRYKPSRQTLDIFGNYGWSNPWGVTFDKWGHPLVLDASPGRNYYLPHLMSAFALDQIGPTTEFPGKHKVEELSFFKKGRPNSGAEFISSANFPPEVQGTYLNGQCIGFHGLRWIWLEEQGSTYTCTRTNDFLTAGDTTFRPVDMMFGPDGGLYILDYYNPIVGHMQYVFRDARRDHTHGRIWRVRHQGRPLQKPVPIYGQPAGKLLALLQDPILRTRFHARRELQERQPEEVLPALRTWLSKLDPKHPDYDLNRLEGWWIYQGHDRLELALLESLLQAAEPNVRASATMALRFELDRIDDPMPYLRRLIRDPNMRVRLEAVNALSFMTRQAGEAAGLILEAAHLELDAGLFHAMKRSLDYLRRFTPVPGYEDSLFTIRELSNGDLISRVKNNFTDIAGYEALSRRLPAAVHADVIDRFQRAAGVSRAETLFRVASAVRRTGQTDIEGIARRLADLSPQDAAAGRDTFQAFLRTDADRADPKLRAAAYAGLVLAGDSNPETVLGQAAKQDQLEDLAAGWSWIQHPPTQDRLFPLLLDFANREKDHLTARFVRDALSGGLQDKNQREERFSFLARLARSPVDALKRGAISAMQTVPYAQWPKGHDAYAGRLKIDAKKLRDGKRIFERENFCGTCHQVDGRGVSGAFPPLVANPWVEGDIERLVKVVNNGLQGPLDIHGVRYNAAMPPMGGLLTDEEIAAVLTYVRTAWDNIGTEVTTDQVKAARAKIGDRAALWTTHEIAREHPIPGWTPPKEVKAPSAVFE